MPRRRRQSPRTRKRPTRVRRAAILLLGLGVAVAAFWMLASGTAVDPFGGGQPMDEIDEASRARLQRVLDAREPEGAL